MKFFFKFWISIIFIWFTLLALMGKPLMIWKQIYGYAYISMQVRMQEHNIRSR